MRQLLIQVPRGKGGEIAELVRQANAVNLSLLDAQGRDAPTDLLIVHVPNGAVEKIIAGLEQFDSVTVTLLPQPVITLEPSQPEIADHVTEVQRLSPIEVYLGGLQSIGSWAGFLAYAVAAAVVVWIGLFTNSAFLLIAAMLIAPFAGPAMNAALATARSDPVLLGRSLLRYGVSLLLTIVITWLISLLLGQHVVTAQMAATASISEVAVLLPLTAGAAGALNLVQSPRSSLVSGTATGVLVAAALAPPAGVIGMSAAMGRWDLAADGLFLLVLQLAGINLAGALAFRWLGIAARDTVYERGKRWLFPVASVVSAVVIAGLLVVQFAQPPDLQRSSIEQRAVGVVEQALNERTDVYLVRAQITFTRPQIPGQHTLFCEVAVQRRGTHIPTDQLRDELTALLQSRLLAQDWNVTPLVHVTVLTAPNDS